MKITNRSTTLFVIAVALFLISCMPQSEKANPATIITATPAPHKTIDVEFTLKTLTDKGKLGYIGVGGDIEGVINPDLTVQSGAIVRIVLINGDGMPHDLFLPDIKAKASYVAKVGEQTELVFEVSDMQLGSYVYYCTVPGHRQAGQEGKLIVQDVT